jgi:hypothetical protein
VIRTRHVKARTQRDHDVVDVPRADGRDLKAIFAYLKTVPPGSTVDNSKPAMACGCAASHGRAIKTTRKHERHENSQDTKALPRRREARKEKT